jgi:hypothetical protein
MSIKLYMDVHIRRAVTTGLRLHGVDVLTAQEDGAGEFEDPRLLDRAAALGRILSPRGDSRMNYGKSRVDYGESRQDYREIRVKRRDSRNTGLQDEIRRLSAGSAGIPARQSMPEHA